MSQTESIRLVIGATRAASVGRAFNQIRNDARRMAEYVENQFNRVQKAHERLRGGGMGGMGGDRELNRALAERIRMQNAADKDRLRLEQQLHSLRMQNLNAETSRRRNSQRREMSDQEMAMRRFARLTSHRTTRFLWPNAPMMSNAYRVGYDLAHGVGMNVSPVAHMQNVTSAQDMAIRISNKAYKAGVVGKERIDPRSIEENARSIAARRGTTTEGMLAGAMAYVGQRGNYKPWAAIGDDIAKRSVAYGIDMEVAGLMAAKYESALLNDPNFMGDSEEAQERRNREIVKLFDNAVHQSKISSIEPDKFARQVPKISGIAPLYGGGVSENIKTLTAIMQMAETGPAANAHMASTYTQNMALDLRDRAGILRSHGLEVLENPSDPQSKLRPIKDIVFDIFDKTSEIREAGRGKSKGPKVQQELLKALIPNKRSNLAFAEMLATIIGAGEGEAIGAGKFRKGMDALKKRMSYHTEGTVAGEELESDYDEAQKSITNNMNKLNAEFEKAAAVFLQDFTPVLLENKDNLVELAKVVSGIATWFVENPGLGIGAMLAMSFARAGLESAFRVGVESIFTNIGNAISKKGALTASTVAVTAGAVYFAYKANEDLRKETGGRGVVGTIGDVWRKGILNPFSEEAVDAISASQLDRPGAIKPAPEAIAAAAAMHPEGGYYAMPGSNSDSPSSGTAVKFGDGVSKVEDVGVVKAIGDLVSTMEGIGKTLTAGNPFTGVATQDGDGN